MNSVARFCLFSMLLGGVFGSANALAMGSAPPAPSKPAPPPPRVLKKLIETGPITAGTITDADHVSFDLQTSINEQFPSVIQQSGKYAVVTPQPGFCIPDWAQMKIGGSVPDFELQSSTGVSLGYKGTTVFNLAVAANFNVSTSLMTVELNATDVTDGSIIAATSASQKDNTTNWGLGVDLYFVSLDFSHYTTSPIGQVAAKGFVTALNQLSAQTNKYPWEAKVLVSDHGYVDINAGINVGIQNGDQFAIYNVEQYWSGMPCQSNLLGVRPMPTPEAVIQVYDAGNDDSWGVVISSTSETNIGVGAKVVVQQLLQTGKTAPPLP